MINLKNHDVVLSLIVLSDFSIAKGWQTLMQLLPGFFLALAIFGTQDFEYGKPSELQGLKKVFVDTGGDMKNRDRISEEIEKAKLGLELLDNAVGAEIILNFGGSKEKYLAGVSTNPQGTFSTPTYRKMNVGKGMVLVVKDNRARVVMSFEDEERTVFEKKPATNFAKTFIKAYKKASGVK